jgi:TP901 family phage tail tape measure protein
MAAIGTAVNIIFSAVDETGGTISRIGGEIADFSDQVGGALEPFDNLADKVKLANAAIVGMGLALGGAALIKAGEFGDQINEIGTLFGGTKEQIDGFAADVQTYASTSTQSLESINGAIYSSISAGVAYGDSLAFLAEAEQLAIAGKADLNSTSVALISTLNAYGESTDQASKYSDTLFQTVKLGQTTLPELAAGLAQVTGIAAGAGVPFDDLSAAVAALTAYGLPTSQAITGIKAAISNIIKPASDARLAAEELGIQFDSGALQSRGFAGVLDDVYKATGGNVGQMGRFFGSVEGLNVALSLGSDTAGKYAGAIDGMANSAGSTNAAFSLMKDNFSIVVQQIQNSVDLLLVSIGDPLKDEFGDLAGAFRDVFKNLKISVDDGAFAPIFAVLGDVENDLTAFLSRLAQNIPSALASVDWTKFTNGIRALSDGIGGMFEGLDLSTPEGLGAAIQMVADAAGNMLAQGGGIADAWGDVITNVILPAIEAFAKMSTEMSRNTGEALGWADALSMITDVVGGVGKGLEAVGDGLSLLSAAFFAAIFKSMIPAVSAFGTAMLTKAGPIGALLLLAEVLGKFTVGEGPIEMAGKALLKMAGYGKDSAAEISNLEKASASGAAEVKNLSDTAKKSGQAIAAGLEPVSSSSDKFAQSFTKVGDSARLSAKDLLSVAKAAGDTEQKLAGIASNERIKLVESRIKLNIADVEANSKIAISLIDSIGKSYEANGDVISNIMGETLDWMDPMDRAKMSLADMANARMNELHAKQMELVAAQIEYMRAKVTAMEDGNPLVTIQADGLKPHLEAFMWEILGAIQVQMAYDGGDMLVGGC